LAANGIAKAGRVSGDHEGKDRRERTVIGDASNFRIGRHRPEQRHARKKNLPQAVSGLFPTLVEAQNFSYTAGFTRKQVPVPITKARDGVEPSLDASPALGRAF